MKRFFISILLAVSSSVFAQDMEKDTIQLKEMAIGKEFKKKYTLHKVAPKFNDTRSEGLLTYNEMVLWQIIFPKAVCLVSACILTLSEILIMLLL